MKCRCVNLDWLEIYVHEPTWLTLDADFFSRNGYEVRQRPYGTRMYAQMFTLYEHGTPKYEIRRDPLSKKSQKGIFVDESAHIRLVNQELYMPQPIQELQRFLRLYGYTFQNISRFDIALDLQRFDNQMKPANFVDLYMRGSYSKIHQANLTAHGKEKNYSGQIQEEPDIAAHGTDSWSGRSWNSLKWGSPTSAISTKLYNKSLELSRQGHDKPYIRDAWFESGLSMDEYGEPTEPVWRIEFSVRSTKRYLTIQQDDGTETKTNIITGESMQVTLDQLADRWSLLYLWHSYESVYFRFKVKVMTRNGTIQRKDRCPDVLLFKNVEEYQVYKPTQVTHKEAPDRTLRLLLKKLREIANESKSNGEDHELLNACATLIRYLKYRYNTSRADDQALEDIYLKIQMEPTPEMRMYLLSQFMEEKFGRKVPKQAR